MPFGIDVAAEQRLRRRLEAGQKTDHFLRGLLRCWIGAQERQPCRSIGAELSGRFAFYGIGRRPGTQYGEPASSRVRFDEFLWPRVAQSAYHDGFEFRRRCAELEFEGKSDVARPFERSPPGFWQFATTYKHLVLKRRKVQILSDRVAIEGHRLGKEVALSGG